MEIGNKIAKEEKYSGENLFIEFIDDNKSKVKNYKSLNVLPENFEEHNNSGIDPRWQQLINITKENR